MASGTHTATSTAIIRPRVTPHTHISSLHITSPRFRPVQHTTSLAGWAQQQQPRSPVAPRSPAGGSGGHIATPPAAPVVRPRRVSPPTTRASPPPAQQLSQWYKVLYLHQPFPDNYVDFHKFTEDMRCNHEVSQWDYWTCVLNTSVVTAQVSLSVIFVTLFYHMWVERVRTDHVLAASGVIFAAWLLTSNPVGAIVGRAAQWKTLCSLQTVRGFVFAWFLLFLTPTLRTLTVQYCNDTVWALSIFFFSFHVFLTDYKYVGAASTKQSGFVSINAALFGSVIIASRLHSTQHCFALLLLAVVLFGLLPDLRRKAHRVNRAAFLAVSWGISAAALWGLMPLHSIFTLAFVPSVAVVTFVAPLLFIRMHQRLKLQIKGPWDEATPPPTASSELYKNAR